MALTREAIIDTALRLLRHGGLDALSLRKIAAELDVSAPTLYWHVGSKRELLDLVAEELLRQHGRLLLERPSPDQPWWEWLRVRTQELYEALIETRDAPRVLAGNRPSVESLPRLDEVLKTLLDAGISPVDAQQALSCLGSYAIGSAAEWHGEAARAEEGPDIDTGLAAALREGELPHLTAAVSGMSNLPARATFEYGLDLVITGLRARYAPESLAQLTAGELP